jgi:hypothetical protein
MYITNSMEVVKTLWRGGFLDIASESRWIQNK